METIKIKTETYNEMLRIIQTSNTGLSFQQMNGFLTAVQKEYEELNAPEVKEDE